MRATGLSHGYAEGFCARSLGLKFRVAFNRVPNMVKHIICQERLNETFDAVLVEKGLKRGF